MSIYRSFFLQAVNWLQFYVWGDQHSRGVPRPVVIKWWVRRRQLYGSGSTSLPRGANKTHPGFVAGLYNPIHQRQETCSFSCSPIDFIARWSTLLWYFREKGHRNPDPLIGRSSLSHQVIIFQQHSVNQRSMSPVRHHRAQGIQQAKFFLPIHQRSADNQRKIGPWCHWIHRCGRISPRCQCTQSAALFYFVDLIHLKKFYVRIIDQCSSLCDLCCQKLNGFVKFGIPVLRSFMKNSVANADIPNSNSILHIWMISIAASRALNVAHPVLSTAATWMIRNLMPPHF